MSGPDGEIIVPRVWDATIEADWEVTVRFWPRDHWKESDGNERGCWKTSGGRLNGIVREISGISSKRGKRAMRKTET